jgi:hypothetical protein
MQRAPDFHRREPRRFTLEPLVAICILGPRDA